MCVTQDSRRLDKDPLVVIHKRLFINKITKLLSTFTLKAGNSKIKSILCSRARRGQQYLKPKKKKKKRIKNQRAVKGQGQDNAGEDHTQNCFPTSAAQSLLTCKQTIRLHTKCFMSV